VDVEGCPLPDDLLYDLELDVWVRPTRDAGGAVVFGMMAPMASFAGKFLALNFREVPGTLHRSQSVATAESVRFTGAIRLPLDGEVVETNRALSERPKLLNDDPYGRGWVARVRPSASDLPDTLRRASEVRAEVLSRIRERRIRCYPATPDVEVYAVGVECTAVLASLDDELARRGPEDVVLVVTDDPTSPVEMEGWRMRTGHSILHVRKEEDRFHFLVRKEARPRPERQSSH
jgi:glycine cleavage system H protein